MSDSDPGRSSRIDRALSTPPARLGLLLALLAAGLLVYRGTLATPLGSDARFLSYQNVYVTQPGGLTEFWTSDFFEGAETHGVPYRSGYYRPVTNTLFWLEYRWAGERDGAYNLLQLLLHGLNAFLLALLVGGVSRSARVGWVAGALFVLHPVHAFAATEPAARADVLFTIPFLIALFLFDRALDRRGDGRIPVGPVAVVSGLFLLSLLSKEMGITLPAVLILLVGLRWARDGGSLRPAVWTLSVWGLFAGYLVWRFGVLDLDPAEMGYAGEFGRVELFLAALKTVPIHLARIVLPLWPSYPELHPHLVNTVGTGFADPLAAIALLVVAGLVGLVLLTWRTQPVVAFWCAFFLVTGSPLLRVDNIGGTLDTGVILTQERWIYLPSMGILALLSAGGISLWDRWTRESAREVGRRPRWVPVGTTFAVAVLLGWSASVHAGQHEDPYAQLRRLYIVPEEKLGRFEQANRLLLYAHWVALPSGDLADAEARARAALALVPDSPLAARSAGEVLARAGRWEEVRDLLTPWIRPDPEWLDEQHRTNFRVYDDWNRVNADAHLLLGRALAHLGDAETARGYFCEARDRGIGVQVLQDALETAPGLTSPLVCPRA